MGNVLQDDGQMEMDWYFGHCKPLLTVNDVAKVFSMCPQQVRDLVDSGRLVAAGIGDGQNPEREHLRVERYSVLALWIYKNELKGNQLPLKRTPLIEHWIRKLREMDAMLGKDAKGQKASGDKK
jgi:hypothetical protein